MQFLPKLPPLPLLARLTAPRPTLILERNGHFDVDPVDIRAKCGPVGENRITYRIVAECRNKLDRNGFLIDHNDLAHYVESTFGGFQPVFPSCELMAERAAEGLWALIKRHGVKPIGLTVSVAAFGQAGVTAKLGRVTS